MSCSTLLNSLLWLCSSTGWMNFKEFSVLTILHPTYSSRSPHVESVGRDANTCPRCLYPIACKHTVTSPYISWHCCSHDHTGEDVEFTFCWWLFYWSELCLVPFGLVENASGAQNSFRKRLFPDNEIPSGSVYSFQGFIQMNSYMWIHTFLLCQQRLLEWLCYCH